MLCETCKDFFEELERCGILCSSTCWFTHWKLSTKIVESQVGIIKNMKWFQRDMETLSMEFENIITTKRINVYAFGEGRPMKDMVHTSILHTLFGTFCVQQSTFNFINLCFCLVFALSFNASMYMCCFFMVIGDFCGFYFGLEVVKEQ